MLTDDPVIVQNTRQLRTIFCIQRSAQKIEVTEDSLVKANIASFGDDIGKTTNWITSMFDVQAQFDPDSAEYKELEYRIKCGQNYQQNCIDKAKGIVCKPMPRYWYDRMANKLPDNPTEEDVARRELNLRIVADRKPYFMRYIYPNIMSDYKKYISNARTKCIRTFGITLDVLENMDSSEQTEEQADFLRRYYYRFPVGIHDCVMNKICRRIENEFDSRTFIYDAEDKFDISILKTDAEYTSFEFQSIMKIYKEFNDKLKEKSASFTRKRKTDDDDMIEEIWMENFRTECALVCPNEDALYNAIIDISYKKNWSKYFAWEMMGDYIIRTLLKRRNYIVSYPVEREDGDIEYYGKRFAMLELEVAHD